MDHPLQAVDGAGGDANVFALMFVHHVGDVQVVTVF
jgi:hypothetical protein